MASVKLSHPQDGDGGPSSNPRPPADRVGQGTQLIGLIASARGLAAVEAIAAGRTWAWVRRGGWGRPAMGLQPARCGGRPFVHEALRARNMNHRPGARPRWQWCSPWRRRVSGRQCQAQFPCEGCQSSHRGDRVDPRVVLAVHGAFVALFNCSLRSLLPEY
jgi:hypothetical protein